jgi:protein ImuB
VLRAAFRLTSRETVTRTLQMPAPMRDPKVLRTLLLLHLESRPLGAGVDRVTISVDTIEGRVTQFSLLGRALPFPEQVATLVARLSALAGEGRVGAPALVDSHRPGSFTMQAFMPAGSRVAAPGPIVTHHSSHVAVPGPLVTHHSSLVATRITFRRFRLPIAASVMVKAGRPVRVTTGRGGMRGGAVGAAAGPWRTSGEWWRTGKRAEGEGEGGWDRDEWDVALADGGIYRIFQDRSSEGWFVEGIVD